MLLKYSHITILRKDIASIELSGAVDWKNDRWLFFFQFLQEIHPSIHVTSVPTSRPVANQINAP
jgi:hypothetical protein